MTVDLAQRVEDRWLISETLSRYAAAYDDGALDDVAGLMVEEGSEDGRNPARGGEWGPYESRAVTIENLKLFKAAEPGPCRHMLTNLIFETLTATDATVRYYLVMLSGLESGPGIATFGWYRSSLVKRGDAWLLTSKSAYLEA